MWSTYRQDLYYTDSAVTAVTMYHYFILFQLNSTSLSNSPVPEWGALLFCTSCKLPVPHFAAIRMIEAR